MLDKTLSLKTGFSRTILAWFASVVCIATGLDAQTSSAGDGYDPNANGLVLASALQPDGKLVIVGNFTTLQPNGAATATVRNRIARLNPDGSLDTGFNPDADGQVNCVLIQSDGHILIGGSFKNLNSTTGAVSRFAFARLNANGTVDTSFNVGVMGDFVESTMLATKVNVIVEQLDGRILVGGEFVKVQGQGSSVSVARRNLVRFNADGSIDNTFVVNANNVVSSIALQRDGKILVGGGFTTLLVGSSQDSVTRNRVARLTQAGAVDAGFNPNANNLVAQIIVQPDGRILLGGNFTTLQPNDAESATTRNYIARLYTDGTIESEFNPNPNGKVSALGLQPNGRILVGGSFSSAQPNGSASTVTTSYFARFLPDGNIDSDFLPGANYSASCFTLLPDGKIIAGGYFTSFRPQNGNTSFPRNYIARLQPDGVLDVDLQSGATGRYYVALRLSNGDMLVGGSFSNIGGVSVQNIARIKETGAVDTSFAPKIDGTVQSIAVQSDGKILIGGSFTKVNDTARNYIARLDSTGGLDTAFNPNTNSVVSKILVQSDSKILLGGSFTTFQPNGSDTTTVRTYLARLNVDGTLDADFDPSPSSSINDMVLLSDGMILLGGNFTSLTPKNSGTSTRYYLARLKADGKVDDSFDIRCNSSVNSMVFQSDGKLLLGGSFTAIMAKGASTYEVRNRIARINADLTLDSFNPNANSSVTSIQVVDGGKIAIAGAFTTLDPNDTDATDEDTVYFSRQYIAVLNADGTVADFNITPNGVINQLLYVSADRLYAFGGFSGFQTGTPASWTYVTSLARLTTSGGIDTSFAPGILSPNGGVVNAVVVERSGTYLLGGKFASFAGSTSDNLVRITPYGVADPTYLPAPNGQINAIVLPPANIDASVVSGRYAWVVTDGTLRNTSNQPRLIGRVSTSLVLRDGSVLIGGSFTVQGNSSFTNLIRLKKDGSLDDSFNPAPNGEVLSLAEQPHNEIVVGGTFTTICGSTRNYIARLFADGTLDAFDPSASSSVYAVALLSDGKILIGGNFTTLQPNAATATTTRNYIARLNADGSLDTTYEVNANGIVQAIVLQGDKAVIAGSFTTVQPTGTTASTTRNYIARLNSDGTLDTGFDPSANGVVQTLAPQSDGKLVVGGQFTTFQPNSASSTTERNYLARLESDGTLDANFNPNPNSTVSKVAVQTDGRILVGGSFTEIASQRRNRVARLTSSGAIDNAFNPDADGVVLTISVASDSSIILGGSFSSLRYEGSAWVGGSFTKIGGDEAINLALLNTDGTLNTTSLPNPDGEIFALLRQADGKIIVGGRFTKIYGTARQNLARLNRDGTLDSTFRNDTSGAVYALAAGADGSVFVGGSFTSIGTANRTRLAKLSAAGVLDASFAPAVDNDVLALQVAPDGSVWLGGAFANVAGQARPFLAHLTATGSLAGFAAIPAPSAKVNAITLHADGRVVIGGEFTSVGGQVRNRIARLTATGTLDTTFTEGADQNVRSLVVGQDGKLYVGGAFSKLRDKSHPLFGRIAADVQADYQFSANEDLTQISWVTGGSTPVFSTVEVEMSQDGYVWQALGLAKQTSKAAAWEYSSIQPPSDSFFLRLRAWVNSSQFGSGHFVESVHKLYSLPLPSLQVADTVIGTAGASFSYAVGSITYGITYSATGLPAGLSIDSRTGLVTGKPSAAGTYIVTYRVDNGSSARSYTQTMVVASSAAVEPTPTTGNLRISNLSARVAVPANGSISVGFTLSGSTPKPMVMRAVGPGLGSFGVSAVMANPRLQLYPSGATTPQLQNQGWGGGADLVAAFNRVGAFALNASSADAAALSTLNSGLYSIRISDTASRAGTVLAELFDGDPTTSTQLGNLSVQGPVVARSQQLLGGFVLEGTGTRRLLIRAIGPGLSGYGVSGVLRDAVLTVYNSRSQVIARNDNWEVQTPLSTTLVPASPAVVALISRQTGAFSLNSGALDSAMVLELPAGVYTIGVDGGNDSSGTAMLEVYLAP